MILHKTKKVQITKLVDKNRLTIFILSYKKYWLVTAAFALITYYIAVCPMICTKYSFTSTKLASFLTMSSTIKSMQAYTTQL